MVCYLSESGDSIEDYAEVSQGPFGEGRNLQGVEYADPASVHPRALKENANRLAQGYWVDPKTVAKRYLWANDGRDLPDVLPGFVVSSDFKELVEQFEPRVHQFVPVEVFRSREAAPVAVCYQFVVGQRVDSVDPDETTYVWEASKDRPGDGHWANYIFETSPLKMVEIEDAKLVYSNAKSSGHHIWHDPHVLTFNNYLCSDEFAKALEESGLTGVKSTTRLSV